MYATALVDRLLATCRHGAWSYTTGNSAAVEPTCWAAMALRAHGAQGDETRSALHWLARLQRSDGSVPVTRDVESPCWVTGLCVLAWQLAEDASDVYHPHVDRAVNWLLGFRGKPLRHNAAVFGHDTSLVGWSWVDGTHSWVEPTAYALLALRQTGRGEHARVREGVRLLLDRAIADGGWNYGNTRVFQNALRPFPGPSGVALTALAGEPFDRRIERGIEYLERELPSVRSPMSLAWGIMGLSAWCRRPAASEQWLAESAERSLRQAPHALHDSLLLFACAEPLPLRPVTEPEAAHG